MLLDTVSHNLRSVLLLLALMMGAAAALRAQPTGPAQQPVYLEHADSFLGYTVDGEEVNELIGNVRITQGVVRIESDRALVFNARNYVVLTGNVRVMQPGQTLLAPRAEYDGNTKVATAPSGMTLNEDGATLRAGSGTYNMYDRIAHFRNGVTLTEGKSTLRASSGDYYSVERRAEFRGGVRVENDSGTITGGELIYWRDSRETHAFNDVVLVSYRHAARLTGDTVIYRPATSYTIALGHPKLVQVDTVVTADSSLRRDTTVIIAMKLEAFRGEREEYIATDSVKMIRGELQAVGALARYLPKQNVIALGPGVRPVVDTTKRDTVRRSDTAADAVTGVRGGGGPIGPYPVVWYEKSQLTGDTITVGLDEKKLRSIDVVGNAFALTEGKLSGRYDQLAGTRLFFDILHDTVRQVRSEGMASSIYFMYEGDAPSGVDRTSGDTIIVDFEEGEASKIGFFGGRVRVEGEYFPEKLVTGQESLYRLEGFRWISREGIAAQIDPSLPKAPAVQDVKPPEVRGVESKPR